MGHLPLYITRLRAFTYCLCSSHALLNFGLPKLAPMTHHQHAGPVLVGAGPDQPKKGTHMPRKTHAQISLLLADLYAAKQDKRKADKRVDDLEAEIADLNLDERPYGEWAYSLGTPREILAQKAIKELVSAYGKSEKVLAAIKAAKLPAPIVPTVFTKAPIVVKPVAK